MDIIYKIAKKTKNNKTLFVNVNIKRTLKAITFDVLFKAEDKLF